MVLGLTPARGGSKGIPDKNLKEVNGKPLIAYAIECGLLSPSIDHHVVSTDSKQIAEVAKQYGAEVPFIRSAKLATDEAPMLPVIQHAILESEKYYKKEVRALVLLDPTAPMRTIEDVEEALKIFRENDCDAVISGNEAHRNPCFNMVKLENGYCRLLMSSGASVGRRQDAPEVFDLNTVVWVYSRGAIMEEEARIPKRTLLYEVPKERSLDIDSEKNVKYLEYIMSQDRFGKAP